jgi:hypothetical protein
MGTSHYLELSKNYTTAHILIKSEGKRREIILFSQKSQNFDMDMKLRNPYTY